MFNLGVSLLVGTLLGQPETDVQALFLQEFGDTQQLLSALKREGVTSIELRNVRARTPIEHTIAAIRTVHDAGLQVSVHIAFEDCAGETYVNRARPFITEALKDQKNAVFTVHPRKDDEETANHYADWAAAFSSVDTRCRLALENTRVTKPGMDHCRLARVEKAIQRAPELTRGLCWDMGHYAYNLITTGVSAESLPCNAILDQMIHTHIHHLYIPDLNTHFPLTHENEPVAAYVKALRERNYAGIYNLELEPERFTFLASPRTGFEQSLSVLKELMK